MRLRKLSALLALLMLTAALGGCSENKNNDNDNPSDTSATEGVASNVTPLVVAYDDFSEKFSPFFAASSYDVDVVGMTSVGLMTLDRSGAPIMNGIEGETRPYNGTDYTYHGIADLTVNIDEKSNTTAYSIKLRDDIKFSDGKPLTADDVIFSYYVLCDTDYTGESTLFSVPIVGLQSYRTGTDDEAYERYSGVASAVYNAGRDYSANDNDAFSPEQQSRLWQLIDEEWQKDINEIIGYVEANYLASAADYFPYSAEEISGNDGLRTAFAMAMWGFGTMNDDKSISGASSRKSWNLSSEFPTAADFLAEAMAAYGNDPVAYAEKESVSSRDILGNAVAAFVGEFGKAEGGAEITSISGIKKLGDYEVEVVTRGFDAAAIYRICGITVAPLHYYGDESLYDYENNSFGFPRGNLSSVRAKTSKPLGAGPYVFDRYENKIVYFTANNGYYLGAPKTKLVQFKETGESDKISAVGTGSADISSPSGSLAGYAEIAGYNSNGETTGETLTLSAVDFLGYGYIGINANTVKVGDNPASAESKSLRRAISTVLAAYRDLAIDSYYGEAAKVINYPISDTSWAAPRKSDSDYRAAYSLDVNGNDIFSPDMNADERYAAALQAAVGYFEAAGYSYNGTALTSAPEGASLSYEIIIPAGGAGDHPTFAILTAAKQALSTIGFTLTVNDPSDSNVLWDKIDAGTHELWCAAWVAAVDPDMYQIYHSDNIRGNGGANSNRYNISDPELDAGIISARTSDDREYRKGVYKKCLDIILDWAVEIPIYQRQNCVVFSTGRIDMTTVTPDITTYYGWLNEIERLEMRA